MKKHHKAIKAFAQALTKCREERGLTKQQLAYESDMDVRSISRLESAGAGVTLHGLFFLAEALKMPASELIRQTEELLT